MLACCVLSQSYHMRTNHAGLKVHRLLIVALLAAAPCMQSALRQDPACLLLSCTICGLKLPCDVLIQTQQSPPTLQMPIQLTRCLIPM